MLKIGVSISASDRAIYSAARLITASLLDNGYDLGDDLGHDLGHDLGDNLGQYKGHL